MSFFILVEEFISALILLIVASQVAVPLVMDRPLFPVLRWYRRRAELKAAKEAIDDASVEQDIEQLRQQAQSIKEKKA